MTEITKKPGIFSRIAGAVVGGLTGLVTGVFTGAVRGLGVMGGSIMGAVDGLVGIGIVGLAILPAIAIGAIVVAAYGAYEGVRNGGQHGFVEGVKAGALAAATFERQEPGKESKKETAPAAPETSAAVQQQAVPGSDASMNNFFKNNPPASVTQVAATPQQTPVKETPVKETPVKETPVKETTVKAASIEPVEKIEDLIARAEKELKAANKAANKDVHDNTINEKLDAASAAIEKAKSHPDYDKNWNKVKTLARRIELVSNYVDVTRQNTQVRLR